MIETIVTFLSTYIDQIIIVLTSTVTAASAVAAVTPNTTDDKVVAALRKAVDWLALNVGHAKPEKSKD